MTLRELSKLYYLNKLIERDSLRLANLESKLEPGGMNISGMPRGSSSKNIIEELVPLIVELKDRIKNEQIKYISERKNIDAYISSVDDYQMRLILSYRFIDLMTWNQIALSIGGGNTDDSVKKACYRFLNRSEKGKK